MSQDQATTLSLGRYAPDAKALVAGAQALADERGHAEVQPLHLLARALDREPRVAEVFRRTGANVIELQAAAERALGELPRSREPAYLAASMLDLLERAEREATRDRSEPVLLEHLLNALSQEIRGPAGELLGAYRVGPGALRPHLAILRASPQPERRPATGTGEFTRDLVDRARKNQLDPVIGRDAEVRRLLTILERRQKSHPLLVGEPGVGKGAVVAALAGRLARGDAPRGLVDARLLEIEVGALVAGARLRGEIEERVKRLLDGAGDDAILVARGVEQLFGQGPAGSGVGELLKPALLRGAVRLLGTTTPEGLRRIADRDATVLRLFTTLDIAEPSVDVATEILRGLSTQYEKHHDVEVSEGAVKAAVRLAKRYVQDRFLPDSAIDLLDETAAAKRVECDGVPAEADQAIGRLQSLRAQLEALHDTSDRETQAARTRVEAELTQLEPRVLEIRATLANRGAATGLARTVSEQDVAATLAVWTGIPVQKMLEAETQKLLRMEVRLGARVVGQDDAVGAVARAVRRGRVGLRDPGKPIGSFLFLGPSGVGKTELAKALASFLFDDERALTRLDMSEFMERHMAQRLIGAPPGYADSEQGGFLTEAVRRRPYSVLLFDEVEKAHQDVFNLLLQVLDDGRLTDGRGRLADFSNTVVIMTSNVGSDRILETDPRLFETDEGREALRDVLVDQLAQLFRPEFLNRIDDVVVFRPLTRDHLRAIVDIQLQRLEGLLGDRRIRVELDAAARERLVELGYEPALGARPLKRAILKQLQDPLAEALLAGSTPDGSTVRVAVGADGKLTFQTT